MAVIGDIVQNVKNLLGIGDGAGKSASFFANDSGTYTSGGSVGSNCVTFSIAQDGNDEPVNFEGLVAQALQVSCGRQPHIVYEIGTKKYYAIDSKPSGNGSLQNILGPGTATVSSLKELGNICHPSTIEVNIVDCKCNSDNKSNSQKGTYKFTGGFLTGVSLSAQAQSYIVQGTWQFSFQDLQVA